MRGEVWAQTGQDRFIDEIPFGCELMQHARLRMHIVEDQTIGDEMTVLDPFPLNGPVVGGNEPLTAKEHPAQEAIEGLALVGCSMNGLAELRVAEILK